MRIKRFSASWFPAILLGISTGFSFTVYAATVNSIVLSDKDSAIEGAVISLEPIDGPSLAMKNDSTVQLMNQEDYQFKPYILPVRTGSAINFPNNDDTLHHVYSFSPIKQFEISLYAGTPAKPIVFNKPGVVPLGCNIHDWMLAYIYVTDAPFFTKSDSLGEATLKSIPAGKYQAKIWHPRLKGLADAHNQTVDIIDGSVTNLNFTISLKRDRRRVQPDAFKSDY